MEVLSPLRLGPDRFAGYDHHRLAAAEPWFSPSFDHSLRFGPRPPPSPPVDMSARISLPSIADILNPSREEDNSTDRRQPTGPTRQRQSYGEAQTKSPAYQPPASHLPPTPPMGVDNARKHDPQPLPTLQPQHVSRIDATSFSPGSRHSRAGFTPMNESKPVLNTNIASFPSPTAMSAPPVSAPSQYPQGQKRRSEAPHTRRSRSPPIFTPRSRPSDTPTSLPPASSVLMGRSLSSEFSTQQPAQRPRATEYPPPSTSSSSSTMTHASLPPQRSVLLDYPPHSHSQSLTQPYSPQSSPSSTKTSTYDPRVRSMSWQQHPHQPIQHHTPRHPSSPYGSAPPSISASHPGAPTDRYICPTCGKCFSRPSSLRIHSHSHTGEKPFRCSRDGCGKAFSVRSNMKRHEKGCHVGIGIVVGPGYLGNPIGLGVSAPGQAQHVGLGVVGLPSIANGMSGARELAPAMDGV